MQIKKFILDILFPVKCLNCGKQDVVLCEKCFEKLLINESIFESIDLSPSYLDGFFIASDWENKILQNAIHKFKYSFVQELTKPLAKLLIKKINLLKQNSVDLKDFIIVPVPLHKRRFAWRGFNQAELLAKLLSKEFKMKFNNNLIKRKKYTLPQVKLKSKDRNKNIQGAFELVGSIALRGAIVFKPLNKVFTEITNRLHPRGVEPTPENILLIDDVITTGATMNEMAKVLKNNGVKKVLGLAIARG